MRTFLTLILLSSLGFAQMEPPQPAAEMAAYDRLLGSWESSGTVDMQGTEGKWTSRSHTRKVMNGHWVRSDTRIDVEGAGSIAFITFFGWDRELQRHVSYEISNMGTITENEVLWPSEDQMMSMSYSTNQGEPKVERWITNFEGDTHTFVGEEAASTGPWRVHVRGSAKKLAEEKPVDLTGLDAFFVQQSPEMKTAAKMAGVYDFEGWFKMSPDVPKMELSGRETATSRFGGTVIEFTSKGQPGDWEGWSAMIYEPTLQRYRMVGIDNMGTGHVTDGWNTDEGWVLTNSGTMYGQPIASRMVMTTDDAGKLTGLTAHALMGAMAPYQTFEATYSLASEVGTRPASADTDDED